MESTVVNMIYNPGKIGRKSRDFLAIEKIGLLEPSRRIKIIVELSGHDPVSHGLLYSEMRRSRSPTALDICCKYYRSKSGNQIQGHIVVKTDPRISAEVLKTH